MSTDRGEAGEAFNADVWRCQFRAATIRRDAQAQNDAGGSLAEAGTAVMGAKFRAGGGVVEEPK
jgi:hypothetical protein